MAVFQEAVVGTFLVAVIVADGERRRSHDEIDAVAESRMTFFHEIEHLLRHLLFPCFVCLSPMTHLAVFPLFDPSVVHLADDDHGLGKRTLAFDSRGVIHQAAGPIFLTQRFEAELRIVP